LKQSQRQASAFPGLLLPTIETTLASVPVLFLAQRGKAGVRQAIRLPDYQPIKTINGIAVQRLMESEAKVEHHGWERVGPCGLSFPPVSSSQPSNV
jgi:hypothetical protein